AGRADGAARSRCRRRLAAPRRVTLDGQGRSVLPLRVTAAAAFAAVMAAAAVGAQAQESYPSKVIRIVTSAPGSNNDWGARLLGDEISPSLGHRVIVENRGGLAAEVVAKSPPDGYTLLFYGPAAWTMQLYRTIGY